VPESAKRTDPLYIAPPPPPNIGTVIEPSSKRRQIQLPPIETSAVPLDDSDDDDDDADADADYVVICRPVPPPTATVNALTHSRSYRDSDQHFNRLSLLCYCYREGIDRLKGLAV
jgi:hypothetical protein